MTKTPLKLPIADAVGEHLLRIKAQAAKADAGQPDVRQLIPHTSGEETLTFMEPADPFDECIVGTSEIDGETVVVYNKMAVISALAETRGLSIEEAHDAFQQSFAARSENYLTDIASGVKLPKMPLFVVDIRDYLA